MYLPYYYSCLNAELLYFLPLKAGMRKKKTGRKENKMLTSLCFWIVEAIDIKNFFSFFCIFIFFHSEHLLLY